MPSPRTYVARSVTAVTAVAAIPTTSAHFAIQNGESVGSGRTYNILAVGFTTTTTAGATMVIQLLAHAGAGGQQPITGTAAVGPAATDGQPSASKAGVFSAVTIVAGNGIWHAVGNAFNTAALTATIGAGTWQNVRGLYSLSPGAVFSLAVLGSTAAGGSQLSVQWEEVQL